MAGGNWPHFRPEELACKCRSRGCRGEYRHDPVFLDALEALRARTGKRLRINYGNRCGVRNVLVGGAAHSRHRRIAVDISLLRQVRHALLAAVIDCGFSGIGRRRTFLHLDRRPIGVTWTYPGAEESWQT